MKHSLRLTILAALVCFAAVSCSNKHKAQYVGEWYATDISMDGEHWDKSLLPEDEMSITINANGTLLQKMGNFEEEEHWRIDKDGSIVLGEQRATVDDNGYMVADHDGMIVRLKKK